MTNGTSLWDQNLEGVALRIAQTDQSPLRVLAGPGTGKTFALMRRVMRLLESGVDPAKMLVCTFTRTAARDIQRELERLGLGIAKNARAGTVHGLCFSLLARTEVLQLTDRVPRPLLRFEERVLLEDLRGTNDEQISGLRRRLDAFGSAWARLQTDIPGWPTHPPDRTFLAVLIPWLRFHESMLVGELVPEALRFVRDNPASPHLPRYDHVLVDEYQDLNKAEQVLLDELSRNATLTVIGDEDQSIYSFKHAHPEGIARFQDTHAGTVNETLDECRRCPQDVVAMANALIASNVERTPRALQPRTTNIRGEVRCVQWNSMVEEADGLAELIRQRVASGHATPGNILVLAPRRQLGYGVRDALNTRGIRAHSFFYEEALDGTPANPDECAAQEAYSLLTLAAQPNDRVSLRCWSGFGSPSLNSGAWGRLREHCETTGEKPMDALERMHSGGLKLAGCNNLVSRYRLLRERLRPLIGVQGRGLRDLLFPPDQAWAEQLRLLTEEFAADGGPAELRELVLRSVTQPEMPTNVDYVRVMSLHKSKGLTADMVIVMGCVEGLIPTQPGNLNAAEMTRSLEEQRRVFYVAVTRCRQTLVLSSVTRLPRDIAHRMGAKLAGGGQRIGLTIASRFMSELGPVRPPTVIGTTIL